MGCGAEDLDGGQDVEDVEASDCVEGGDVARGDSEGGGVGRPVTPHGGTHHDGGGVGGRCGWRVSGQRVGVRRRRVFEMGRGLGCGVGWKGVH